MDIVKLFIILNLLGTFPVKPNLYAPIMKKYLFYISQNYSFAILRPIQKILLARGDEVYWFFEGSAINGEYLHTSEKCLNDMSQVMKYQPNAVLAPAQSIPSFLPGLKVAIFHGFNIGKLSSRGENDHFKFRPCFDLYCTQGPDTTLPFMTLEKKFDFFNVVETGWSALDPLFTQNDRKNKTDTPVILFCSTFSKRLTCARQLFSTVTELSKSETWKWIVQFHPKMDPEITHLYKSIQNENLTYIETDNVIPLLQQADVMVCDTSSVIPMFLTQNKPVVTFKNILPGPHLIDIKSPSELEGSLKYALTKPKGLMNKIALYVDSIHPYKDGLSSKRVIKAIDDVLDGKLPVSGKMPSNLIRNLKYRKRLNYWNWG